MDVAKELALSNAAHGTVVEAAYQRIGRGRFSRRWDTNFGDSLLVSIVIRDGFGGNCLPLAIPASLAVLQTTRDVLCSDCTIKWPNDVYVGEKKIAGILVESQIDAFGDGFAVVGIGFNVNLKPSDLPEISTSATSLAWELGSTVSLSSVRTILYSNLEQSLARAIIDPQESWHEWRESLNTLGSRVTVHARHAVFTGIAEDVDISGNLLLRSEDSVLHSLSEGDVSFQG